MRDFELVWDGVIAGTPEQVWDGFTRHAAGWLWEISYEPRVGGAERGLSSAGGLVTAWEPARRFVTRAETPDGWWNELEYRLEPHPAGTHVRYRHSTVFADDEYAVQDAACRAHTALYMHSLGEYVRAFAGREPVHVEAHGPAGSTIAAVRAALGVPAPAGGRGPGAPRRPGARPDRGRDRLVEPGVPGRPHRRRAAARLRPRRVGMARRGLAPPLRGRGRRRRRGRGAPGLVG